MERVKAPGLKWRPRQSGDPVPYWIASDAAVKAGYEPKSVRLTGYGSYADLLARRYRLQRKCSRLRHGISSGLMAFRFALSSSYQTDPESSYRRPAFPAIHTTSTCGGSRATSAHARYRACDARPRRSLRMVGG
jgi:hypothetical protein